jgi:hypothetical protein
MNTRMAPFDNVKVRKAIAAALPYDDMFQASIFGRGAKLYGGDWTGSPPDASFPRAMPREPTWTAPQLLAEAGFPNGFSTSLHPQHGRRLGQSEPVGALVKESLARIGIQVDIQKMPDAQFNTAQAEKRLGLFIDGATAWLPETDYYMKLYFTRDQRWNFSNFNNAEMNALTEQAQYELDPVLHPGAVRRADLHLPADARAAGRSRGVLRLRPEFRQGGDRDHPQADGPRQAGAAAAFLLSIDVGRGNLGRSLNTGQNVVKDLRERLPASLELTFSALLIALSLAMPLGMSWRRCGRARWSITACASSARSGSACRPSSRACC